MTSRSSEIRAERHKVSREKFLQLEKMQKEYIAKSTKTREQLLEELELEELKEEELRRHLRNMFPLNEKLVNYGFHPVLLRCIEESAYYKSMEGKTMDYDKFVDEIFTKVKHVEPFDKSPAGERIGSIAFCLLKMMYDFKLTRNQVDALLQHKDGPYIRAMGALYLRIGGSPEHLWENIIPLLGDTEEFTPGKIGGVGGGNKVKLNRWIVTLFTNENRYYGTIIPRLPVLIDRSILSDLEARKMTSGNMKAFANASSQTKISILKPGTIVRAQYSEDKQWYDARVEEKGDKPDTYWVTYLPEEEYGNQEQLHVSKIIYKRKMEDDDAFYNNNSAGGEEQQQQSSSSSNNNHTEQEKEEEESNKKVRYSDL